MKKQNLVWGALIVLAIVAIVVLRLPRYTQKSEVVIKIGVVSSLSGPGAVFGNSFLAGVTLAEEELQKQTVGTKVSYQIIAEDDGGKPGTAASAAEKLITVDRVQAILTTNSSTGNAVAPIARMHQVVHLCSCADPAVADGRHNFAIAVTPAAHAKLWVVEAMRRSVHHVAIVNQVHPGIDAIIAEVSKAAKTAGIAIADTESFPPETRDFKTLLVKVRTSKPEVYYVVALPPALDILGKEMQQLRISPISSSVAISLTADPKLFEGAWYTDVQKPSDEFINSYEQRFPDVRFDNTDTPIGYDMVKILASGFASQRTVADYVAILPVYTGQSGVMKQKTRGIFEIPPVVWKVKDGKTIPVSLN